MPEINNYSFSNAVFNIQEGTVINNQVTNATITISPLSGYTATASDFSTTSPLPDYVQGIAFTQDGENVLCTITFLPTVTMPSANVTIPLCVIGSADIAEITIAGTFIANVGSNVTGDTSGSYSDSGAFGETELMLTKTYTADSGYKLTSTGMQVVVGNQNDYNIEQAPTYDVDGNLTSITYSAYYTYPNQSVADDKLAIFQVSAAEIFVKPQYVTNYQFKHYAVSGSGGTLIYYVHGQEGATFSLNVVAANGSNFTPANNVTIPANGVYEVEIEFPNIWGQTYLSDTYTLTISGDLEPNFSQPTSITVVQSTMIPRIKLTATSSYGITGYSEIEVEGAAYTKTLSPLTKSIEWTLTVPSGTISAQSLSIDYGQVVLDNNQVANPIVASDQSNVNNINVDSTLGILPGDVFNNTIVSGFSQTATGTKTALNAELYSPFEYTVTSVNSSTNISVTPNISVNEDFILSIVRNGGNVVNLSNISITEVDSTTVKLNAALNVYAFGYEDKTFTLNLDEVIDFTPNSACGSVGVSGGEGITDYSLDLDPTGGVVAFLVNGQGLPDKFEILHGGASGNKKATSSMSASGNFGPFDNIFGTSPSNLIPTSLQLNADQFIGTNKGTIPNKTTEFNLDTGFTIPSMTVGGKTYQQVVWWQYTAADYTSNPNATIRITGPSGTAWDALRLCCPDANCT